MHEDFDKYYKSRNQGKCIKFCVQMCTALIQAKFSKTNTKLLDLSGTQALVLLAFNSIDNRNGESLTLESIVETTGLQLPELKKQLISLSMLEH